MQNTIQLNTTQPNLVLQTSSLYRKQLQLQYTVTQYNTSTRHYKATPCIKRASTLTMLTQEQRTTASHYKTVETSPGNIGRDNILSLHLSFYSLPSLYYLSLSFFLLSTLSLSLLFLSTLHPLFYLSLFSLSLSLLSRVCVCVCVCV